MGTVDNDTDEDWETDTKRFDNYNYFLTREEAERTARYEKAARVLDYHIRQFETVEAYEYGYEFYLDKNGLVLALYYSKASGLPKLKNKADADKIREMLSNEIRTYLTGGEE